MRQFLVGMFALAMTQAFAEPAAIGLIKTVSGEAFVATEGKQVKAVLGTPVYQGSILKTGSKSSLGVVFQDQTVMSFGPNTELTVDDYLYAPAKSQVKLASQLTKGSLNYVSGSIAKLQPEAVTVKTPTGTIGVRGTQFLVKVGNDAD